MTLLTGLLIMGCAGGGGGSGSGGGGTETHAFYIGCRLANACNEFLLHHLKPGATEALKIGVGDTIEAGYNGESNSTNPKLIVHKDKVYYTGRSSGSVGIVVYDPNQAEQVGVNPKKIQVPDINSGSQIYEFKLVGDKIYFTFDSTVYGRELFVFDTEAAVSSTNPGLVVDLIAGVSSSVPSNLAVIDGKIYYSGASSATSGFEPMVYDPNQAISSTNPMLLANLNTVSSGSSSPRGFIEVSGKIYFSAATPTAGIELWVYDPGVALSGTNPSLIDVLAGSGSSNPRDIMAIGSKLYFRHQNDPIYVYDTTQAIGVTNPSVAVQTGSGPGDIYSISTLLVFDGKLMFSASNSVETELWVYDPSLANSSTNPLELDFEASVSADPTALAVVGNKLFFSRYVSGGNIFLFSVESGSLNTPVQYSEASSTNGMGDFAFDMVAWVKAL